jgi:hypothetical protein
LLPFAPDEEMDSSLFTSAAIDDEEPVEDQVEDQNNAVNAAFDDTEVDEADPAEDEVEQSDFTPTSTNGDKNEDETDEMDVVAGSDKA